MTKVVLLTKHKKLSSVAPALTVLGFAIEEFADFDTDTLGTFSGEIERTLSPKECALQKAKKACELGDCDIGLGSEGSFGGGPMAGFMNWNTEILCFYNRLSDSAVFAFAEGPTNVNNIKAKSFDDLTAKIAKYPQQYWIYRKGSEIFKGLDSSTLSDMHTTGILSFPVNLEPDLRAMHCPERRQILKKAAEDLARRLISPCPQCHQVDFVVKDIEKGLPCQLCQLPTQNPKFQLKRCDHCGYEEKLPVEKAYADPATCGFCNP